MVNYRPPFILLPDQAVPGEPHISFVQDAQGNKFVIKHCYNKPVAVKEVFAAHIAAKTCVALN